MGLRDASASKNGWRSVSYKWMDGLNGLSPGGVKYRAAYAANNSLIG